jgi:hypothetical protein
MHFWGAHRPSGRQRTAGLRRRLPSRQGPLRDQYPWPWSRAEKRFSLLDQKSRVMSPKNTNHTPTYTVSWSPLCITIDVKSQFWGETAKNCLGKRLHCPESRLAVFGSLAELRSLSCIYWTFNPRQWPTSVKDTRGEGRWGEEGRTGGGEGNWATLEATIRFICVNISIIAHMRDRLQYRSRRGTAEG